MNGQLGYHSYFRFVVISRKRLRALCLMFSKVLLGAPFSFKCYFAV